MDHYDIMKHVHDMINRSVNGENRTVVYTAGIEVNDYALALLKEKYIAFDVETTGLNPVSDRIVEIGAVKFQNGKVCDVFSTLINSEIPISASASSVNHITNEMLKEAPIEAEAINHLVEFMGDAFQGETILCAHNAEFDMRFLKEALKRNKIEAKIYYIDTLSLSRNLLHKIENHKQDTVARYFDIVNHESHRASSDAEVCGMIMWELAVLKQIENEQEEKRRQEIEKKEQEKATLNEVEKKVCAFVQKCIEDNGGDTKYLAFTHVKHGCLQISYFHRILLFRCTSKSRYLIVDGDVDVKGLESQDCPQSEAPSGFRRVFFEDVNDLTPLCDYIYKSYKKAKTNAAYTIRYDKTSVDNYMNSTSNVFAFAPSEIKTLLDL